MIRQATHDDLARIVEMADKFYQTTKYKDVAEFNAPTCAAAATVMIDQGVMLVAEVDESLVGMIGLAIVPFMFNCSVVGAHEVVWWVNPEYQGRTVGMDLLKAAVDACKDRGAKFIQMALLPDSPPVAAKLYEKLGFIHSETSYTKVI